MKQRYCLHEEINEVKYGVWVDGTFTWLESENWLHSKNVKKNETEIFINSNENLSITVERKYYNRTMLQDITINNLMNKQRDIKLFISQNFTNKADDSVTFYAPSAQAMVRSYKDQYLLLNGVLNKRGIVQYCTDFDVCDGLKDGQLMIQPFSYGDSMSIFSLEGTIEANEKMNAYFWLCNGSNDSDIINENLWMQLNVVHCINNTNEALESCSN